MKFETLLVVVICFFGGMIAGGLFEDSAWSRDTQTHRTAIAETVTMCELNIPRSEKCEVIFVVARESIARELRNEMEAMEQIKAVEKRSD